MKAGWFPRDDYGVQPWVVDGFFAVLISSVFMSSILIDSSCHMAADLYLNDSLLFDPYQQS